MLQWRKTSNLSSCDFRNDQVSAPTGVGSLDGSEEKVLVVHVEMGVAPCLFQGAHGGIHSSNSCGDIIVVS